MKDIDDILKRFLENEESLSEKDKEIFDEWKRINGDYDFFDLFASMRKGVSICRDFREKPENDYTLIKEKIRVTARRRFILKLVSSVACVAVLFLSIMFLERDLHEIQKDVKEYENNEKSKATLILADGRVYELDSSIDESALSDTLLKFKNLDNTIHILDEEVTNELTTLVVPNGAEYNVVLSDGTRVFLNSGSELRFPGKFSGCKREVYLDGEGYFEVEKDSTKQFWVHANEMTAIVLGTSFNIKSYKEHSEHATTLESGMLKVICKEQEFIMESGNQVLYDTENEVVELREVNLELYTSWRYGYYYFNAMTLGEIMSTLSYWYDVKVNFSVQELSEIRFSGRLKRYDDLSTLLDKFEETDLVRFIINDNEIDVLK